MERALSKQLQTFIPIDSNDGIRTPTKKELENRLLKIHQNKFSIRLPERSTTGLVFDCGTNETKAILYTLKNGHIQMREINSKDGWREGVAPHLIKGTPTSFLLKKFEEIYIKACESIDTQEALDFCVVGASSWARKFSKDVNLTEKKNKFMHELRDNGFFPCIFRQDEESHFELLATVYSFSLAQMYSMIPKHLKFGGVLASGGGSSQYTMFSEGSMHLPLNIEIGNREGTNLFKEHVSTDPLKVMDDWISRMTQKIDEAISKNNGFRKNSGFVLCISAQYYAAVEMCKKLKQVDSMDFANKSNEAKVIHAGNALKCAARYVEQQRQVWKEMTTEERSSLIESPKALKSWAMGICIVSLCAVYWVRSSVPLSISLSLSYQSLSLDRVMIME